jgi:hypothetical protein
MYEFYVTRGRGDRFEVRRYYGQQAHSVHANAADAAREAARLNSTPRESLAMRRPPVKA